MLSDKKKSVVIALGYFDSVHIGHRKVILSAKKLSEELNSDFAVFTFSGNLKGALSVCDEKSVYSFSERKDLLLGLGVKEIYSAPLSKEFLSLTKTGFLDLLNGKYDIKGYVCGKDFRFGKMAEGDVKFIKEYAQLHNQTVLIVDDVDYDNKKVSTSYIKILLSKGEIEKANLLLEKPYFISGKVIEGRKVGRKIGFRTANIIIDDSKYLLKDGVYFGRAFVEGKIYKAIINYGSRPTYGLEGRLIEAHLMDFDKDIYGKDVKLEFLLYMRDIIRFNTEKELADQLEKDKKYALEKDL